VCAITRAVLTLPLRSAVNPRMGGGQTHTFHKQVWGVDLLINFFMTAVGIPINPPAVCQSSPAGYKLKPECAPRRNACASSHESSHMESLVVSTTPYSTNCLLVLDSGLSSSAVQSCPFHS
jgi:hypothetical protein